MILNWIKTQISNKINHLWTSFLFRIDLFVKNGSFRYFIRQHENFLEAKSRELTNPTLLDPEHFSVSLKYNESLPRLGGRW